MVSKLGFHISAYTLDINDIANFCCDPHCIEHKGANQVKKVTTFCLPKRIQHGKAYDCIFLHDTNPHPRFSFYGIINRQIIQLFNTSLPSIRQNGMRYFYEEIASELLCNMQPSLFYQYMLISTRICINKGNLQLHPIQILRLGDIEIDLDAVATGQGHGFDEMGGDELALCGGGGIEHLSPGQKLLVLFL